MKVERTCVLKNLDWSLLSELPSELQVTGYRAERAFVSITYGPETAEFHSLPDAVDYVRESGAPDDFNISLHHQDGQNAPLTLRILRGPYRITAMIEGGGTRHRIASLLDAVTTFLSLQPKPLDWGPIREMALTQVGFHCEPLTITWSAVEQIPTVLALFGLTVEEIEASLERFPRTVKLANLRDVVQDIEQRGSPSDFVLKVQAEKPCRFTFSLRNSFTAHRGDCLLAELSANNPEEPLRAVMNLLGLVPQKQKRALTNLLSAPLDSLGSLAKGLRHGGH